MESGKGKGGDVEVVYSLMSVFLLWRVWGKGVLRSTVQIWNDCLGQ